MMEKVNRLIVYYPQKTPAIFITNKGLISRTYKELLLIHSENTSQNKKKMGKRCEQAFHRRKDSKDGH